MLIITGSMGAGKTSVLGEASDILALQNLSHAAIDLDAFGLAHLQAASNRVVMYRNLRCVCKNYASLGVRRFLVARVVSRQACEPCGSGSRCASRESYGSNLLLGSQT